MFEKIQLYQIRNFSDKFSATFDFVRQNWRVFLRITLYLWLPLAIIQGIFVNSYYSALLGEVFTSGPKDYANSDMPWGMMSLLLVVSIVSFIMVWSVTYAVLKKYEDGDGDISQLTIHDIKPLLKRNSGRMCLTFVAYIAVYIAFILLGMLAFVFSAMPGSSVLFVILLIGVMVAIMPPLSLFPTIYLMEDDATLWGSFKKSFDYGFRTWGGLFALLFVFIIIGYASSTILLIPSMIMSAVKSAIFPAASAGSILAIVYTIILDIFTIAATYGSWLVLSLILVALAFHYGHAAELLDEVSVEKDIEQFEEVADKENDDEVKSDIDNFDNL